VSDDETARRFAADRDAYRIPEQRSVQYLLVDEAALQGRVTVTDREIEGYYEEHRTTSRSRRRRARAISW
jgi:peptidyl-prolyl cis-trans isomerase D